MVRASSTPVAGFITIPVAPATSPNTPPINPFFLVALIGCPITLNKTKRLPEETLSDSYIERLGALSHTIEHSCGRVQPIPIPELLEVAIEAEDGQPI